MDELGVGAKWWRDVIAKLFITIIGGVVAAVIVAFVIPALVSGGDSTEAPTEDVPADVEEDPPAAESVEDTDPAPEATEEPAEGE